MISVATGVGYTVGEIVNIIQEIAGTNKLVVEDTTRIRPENSEVFKLICANRKTKELLGWQPTISMQQGLIHAVDLIKNNLSKFDSNTYNI